MADLSYSPAEIEMINSTIRSTVSKLDNELDTVESKCKPLEGEAFKGAAQNAYLEAKTMWREAALEIAQVMNRLAVSVSQAGTSMQDADTQAAGWFNE
ncbi:MAG: WXG100 family type VII secretion target [Micromonosporaceae bacterium]